MARFARYVACCLAAFFGLIGLAGATVTQQQAYQTCMNAYNNYAASYMAACTSPSHCTLGGRQCGHFTYPLDNPNTALCYALEITETVVTGTDTGHFGTGGSNWVCWNDTSCVAGQIYTDTFIGGLSLGDTKCFGGCIYSFHPGPDHPQDAQKLTMSNVPVLASTVGTMTSTGATCSPDAPEPPNVICDATTGSCLKWNGQKKDDTSSPMFCDAAGVCKKIPQGNDPGGCSTSANDALCIGPSSDSGNNNTNPPAAPSPPILPGNPGPSVNNLNFSTTTSPAGGGPDSTNTNSGQDSHCGGAGEAPCVSGSVACPQGTSLQGGVCVSGSDPSCPSGSTYNGITCITTPQCPAGQTNNGGVCSGGSQQACAPGYQLVNGTCTQSPTCPDGYKLVDGSCEYQTPPSCPSGQIMDNDGVCHAGSCPTGYTNVNGQCELSPPTCPSGQTMVNGACTTPCATGQTRVNGTCVANAPGNCVGGTFVGTTCTCPAGQTLVNGACAVLPPPPLCIGGTVVAGLCICPSNLVLGANGVCQTQSLGGGDGGNGGNGGNGSGSGSGSGSNNQGTDTCATHPTAAGCVVNAASGGADCSAAPSCSGDQALCNIDFQIWHAQCPGVIPVPTDATAAAASLDALPANGNSAITTDDGTAKQQALDSSGWLAGSGSCVQFDPLTVSFSDISTSFDFNNSSWCLVSQMLRALLLLLSYFKAGQIIMRG